MTEPTLDTLPPSRNNFLDLTSQIRVLLDQDCHQDLLTCLDQYDGPPNDGRQLLVSGFRCFVLNDFQGAVRDFELASKHIPTTEYPESDSPWSKAFVSCQLALPRRERPVVEKGYRFFKANIAALRQVDDDLARQISSALWPEHISLVDFWDGIHFYLPGTHQTLVLSPDIRLSLSKIVGGRESISFGGVGTGQELIYCLANQVNILYGMTRPHYLFDASLENLKAVLHLADFSTKLMTRELVLFGGPQILDKANAFFGSARYPLPNFAVGVPEIVHQCSQQISNLIVASTPVEQVRSYYQSAEFQNRLRDIAAGTLKPRIFVNTCKWTTFLKYCAADFDKAFAQIGCETRFLIEENDVQTLTPALFWRELDAFKPDAFFMVSHARPSIPYIPAELPFICYMQDKCGPLLSLVNLKEHIQSRDLFVCMVDRFVEFLSEKGVSKNQITVMPIPADESMFYPLPTTHPSADTFRSDVSFVKHGGPETQTVFTDFLSRTLMSCRDVKTTALIESLFRGLFEQFCETRCDGADERDLQNFVYSRVPAGASPEFIHAINQWVTTFYLTVYSAAWRYQFLEALAQAGISPALYGNGWENNQRLKSFNRGPVDRNTQLNAVYNFSKINLSINQGITMHQRLSECGLAGGFIMVANHPENRDWLPASRYFVPDKEIVLFDSPADLIDKCRYYLDHDRERQDIASRLRERCLREQTCKMGAETILTQWRKIL